MNTITNNLGLLPDEIDPQRIRRSFNRVFNLSRIERLNSWGMLESFIQIIRKSGGYGNVHKNTDGLIDFVGIVPNYAIRFMSSSLFFPVTQLDSRFQTCIASGRLYGLVTLTGNQSLLPLAFGWASSERGEFTDMLFDFDSK